MQTPALLQQANSIIYSQAGEGEVESNHRLQLSFARVCEFKCFMQDRNDLGVAGSPSPAGHVSQPSSVVQHSGTTAALEFSFEKPLNLRQCLVGPPKTVQYMRHCSGGEIGLAGQADSVTQITRSPQRTQSRAQIAAIHCDSPFKKLSAHMKGGVLLHIYDRQHPPSGREIIEMLYVEKGGHDARISCGLEVSLSAVDCDRVLESLGCEGRLPFSLKNPSA